MKSKLHLNLAALALACFTSVGVLGQTKISTPEGLKAIAENLNGDYVIENNITLTEEWTPIGTSEKPFTGTIDGGGHTISNLKINLTTENAVGFIGTAKGGEEVNSTQATIKNLHLVDVEIYGQNDVGAIIGNSLGAKVSGCYTSGLVRGVDHSGGIIGGTKKLTDERMTEVSNCYSSALVMSRSWQAGGIIGASINSIISNCYFSGVAVCPSGRSGGIVALNDGGTLTIQNCVTLSGYIKAGSGDVGGANAILGATNTNATSILINNFAIDNIKLIENGVEITPPVSDSGANCGEFLSVENLKKADFWLSNTKFDAAIWNVENGKYPSLSGVSTPLKNALYIPEFPERCLPGKTFNAEVAVASGRTVIYTSSNPNAASIDNNGLVTFIADGETTLTFSDQAAAGDEIESIIKTYVLAVKGVAYTIVDEGDLFAMKYDMNGDFMLGANIKLTKEWAPLGTKDEPFTGKLNGQGYVIQNLHFVNKEKNEAGMFAYAKDATIQKVGIVGANMIGNADVGAIVGVADGCTISECYVDQSSYIAGRDHIGSIVGKLGATDKADDVIISLPTTVSNCYSMAKVYSREYQAGGIAGVVNNGTLEKCFFSGNVIAEKGRAGGIFSIIDGDGVVLINNNVSLASGIYCPDGGTFCIGEKGNNRANATLSNNYVDFYASYKGSDLSGSSVTDSSDPASNNGATLTNDEVLSSDFYSSDLFWNFTDIWTFIVGGEGHIYPILKCQQSQELIPLIYGVPEQASMIQASSGLSITPLNLETIKSTCGQKLTFDITQGAEYIAIDGSSVEFLGEPINGEQTGTVTITANKQITGLKPININSFDIKMVGQGYAYPIRTKEDLLAVNEKLFADFRLENNIDMTGVTFNGIGSSSTPFTGSFDGNGYSILNPVVSTADGNNKGFFNATKGAKIKKLGLVNLTFNGAHAGDGNSSGSTDIGGFAGSAEETLFDQCFITGKIIGRDHVGGFVGGKSKNVTITNSYVNADVLGYSQAGGFFGIASGNITMRNCYFAGSVKLNPAHRYGWVGGFVGLVDVDDITVTIENCVSIGDLQGDKAAGSFIGANGGGDEQKRAIIMFTGNLVNYDAKRILMDETVSVNDWESKGYQTKEGGNIGSVNEGYSSDKEFYTQSLYTQFVPSFDFNSIWTIKEGEGYPTLANVPYVVTGIDQVVATNGNKYTVRATDQGITVGGMSGASQIALYNLNGQIKNQISATNESVEIAVPSKGFYIVRIVENNVMTSVKVIVK